MFWKADLWIEYELFFKAFLNILLILYPLFFYSTNKGLFFFKLIKLPLKLRNQPEVSLVFLLFNVFVLFTGILNLNSNKVFETMKALAIRILTSFLGSDKSAFIAANKRLLRRCFWPCFSSLSAGSWGRRNRKPL